MKTCCSATFEALDTWRMERLEWRSLVIYRAPFPRPQPRISTTPSRVAGVVGLEGGSTLVLTDTGVVRRLLPLGCRALPFGGGGRPLEGLPETHASCGV